MKGFFIAGTLIGTIPALAKYTSSAGVAALKNTGSLGFS